MPTYYKSQSAIGLPPDGDIIHDPDIRFFTCDDEPSYTIKNFIDEKERKALFDFFTEEYERTGENINNKILHINHPIRHNIIKDIVHKKLVSHFGDKIVYYSDVSNDPINVGDQFFKIESPYQLHTDCVTHIPGYKPYKDVIIPIEMAADKELFYYICEQRYKSRGSQFQKGRSNFYFPSYSNVLRSKPYEEYGVENVKYDAIQPEWFEKHVSDKVSRTAYEGISIEGTFPWIPGDAIVQDSCAIHGSSNFNTESVPWKIGLTFHLLIADSSYGHEIDGEYYTKFSRYTKPLIKA